MIFNKAEKPEQPSQTRPQHNEIDAWGLTHPGKVRKDNQDHFFLGSVSRGVVVDDTSLGTGIDPVMAQDHLDLVSKPMKNPIANDLRLHPLCSLAYGRTPISCRWATAVVTCSAMET